jgi:tetratricopeptide (TPR) repeat protein
MIVGLFIFASCATLKNQQTEYKFKPITVVATPNLPDALEGYDEATLFERGVELLDAAANEEAILYFERLLGQYPESRFAKPSYYNLGVAFSNLHRCEEALEQFGFYIDMLDPNHEYQDSVDARFKQGVCLAELGKYKEVTELFDVMLVEPNLRAADRVEALVDSGIGHFMLGDHVTTEYRMRDAIRVHRSAEGLERLEADYHVAQAHFYIGEVYRAEFSRMKLALPPAGEEQKEAVMQALEQKCQRLLSAQYAYIRSIKVGNPGWATAAGYRIGTLYEELYDDMVTLPVPADLTEEQAAMYLNELKARVHVLIRKAMLVWQRSLDMAHRTGAENEWVHRTQTSLERLQHLMAAEASSEPST